MGTADSQHQVLGPVFVGTDGSDHAARAILWAAAEATARHQPLTLVHATGSEQRRDWTPDAIRVGLDEGHALIEAAAAKVSQHYPALRIETVLSRGAPGESLLEAVGPQGTLVVGSRGHGGFSALLLGSVSLRVAARSHEPVVVVRETGGPAGKEVVAAVRDDGDRDVLRFAACTAHLHGATLKVVSAWMFLESVGSMTMRVDDVGVIASSEAAATARTVGPIREEFPDLTIVEHVVRSQSVAGSVVEASRAADLVVMGARRPAHALGAPLGRVTHAVLHHSPCPVAVIPRV